MSISPGAGTSTEWEGLPSSPKADLQELAAAKGIPQPGEFRLFADASLTTTGLVGSYVDRSLRDYAAQDDWRQSQTIAGTRTDPALEFASSGWGNLAEVGLTHGSDDNWEDFSVQWDGYLQVVQGPLGFATWSDDSSRMWIDIDGDGTFASTGAEFVDNHWGTGQAAPIDITLSGTSVPKNSPAGTGIGRLRTLDSNPSGGFTYRLVPGEGDADNQMFQIATDRVLTQAVLESTAPSVCSIRVRSTDADGLWREEVLQISVTSAEQPSATLDVNGSGQCESMADGLLILRYLLDFRGDALTRGLSATGATRTDPVQVATFLEGVKTTMLDVDGNGLAEAFTDGLMLLRYLFDFRGHALVAGTLSEDAARTDPQEIVNFLDSYQPQPHAKGLFAVPETAADSRLDPMDRGPGSPPANQPEAISSARRRDAALAFQNRSKWSMAPMPEAKRHSFRLKWMRP